MTLLDTVLADDEDAGRVREAVHARQAYLGSRAQAIAASDEPREPRSMVPASLWLEACETAAFAGEYGAAREALREASRALAGAHNPFGETLRAAFLPSLPPAELPWGELRPPGYASEGSPLAWALFNQQRHRLAAGEGLGEDRLGLLAGEPRIGRLGWRPAALLGLAGWGREQREAFLASALSRQWDALQSAQRNRYLWREMLAPVALFDLELAVLLRHGLASRHGILNARGLVERLEASGPRRFAQSYLDTVDALMEREPDEGERALVLEGQR